MVYKLWNKLSWLHDSILESLCSKDGGIGGAGGGGGGGTWTSSISIDRTCIKLFSSLSISPDSLSMQK